MLSARLIALFACALGSASGFAVAPAPRCEAAVCGWARARQVTLVESETPATKITVRTPSSKAASAAAAAGVAEEGGKPKVTVRVRSPTERSAASVAPAPPADEDEDDSMMVSSVKVKAPPKKAAPPPAPEMPALSEAEESLLDAVQKANCSGVLDALQRGANPNVRDPKGRTPLHFIAGVGLAPAAVLLVHFGAQLDARDEGGLTPLHMAAGYANAQSLRVLVAAGADANLTAPQQGTAFEVVCQLGDFQLKQVWESRKGMDRFKKKDEKLEKLRACMDVLDDVEGVRAEADWDAMLTDVLKAIGGTSDENVL